MKDQTDDGDTDRLSDLLQASEALDADVEKFLGKFRPRTKRGLIAPTLCHIAFEHAASQRQIMKLGYLNNKLIAVLWNRNLLPSYTSNAAVVAAEDLPRPRMRLL